MKKSNFAALILGTIGMVFFALGMCMALIGEWGMFRQGVIAGVIGLVILLITLIVWRRMEGKEPIHLNGKTVGTIILSVFGALLFGIGMHGIRKNGTWCCDRTCRNYRIVDVNSINKRIKIKIIENIIYAKDTAYRMKVL